MGVGIYGAVWMFSGMSGLHCAPVIGRVQAGAAGPAVKSTVKEILHLVPGRPNSLTFKFLYLFLTVLPSFCMCGSANFSAARGDQR